jgi:hypothetical protein
VGASHRYNQPRKPEIYPDNRFFHAVLLAATEVQAANIALRQCVPGYCDDPGNDAVDRLSQEAARSGKTHPFRLMLKRENAYIRGMIRAQWEQDGNSSLRGGHSRKIENTRPEVYTRRL